MKITNDVCKKIKELHGVDCAPYSAYDHQRHGKQPLVESLFTYMGVPRSRLHDCCGRFGGCYYVDVPNIFRNFDADVDDPESYDFYYTDEYIGAIIDSGAQIVYRLGITIEWGTKKYVSYPPADFEKWARICEHIIRHYNEGWKDGYHYNIEYWEIWNEPENPPMWQGTREEFFELYRISSKHLKVCFPNLKIGGYGSCGFYAVFNEKRKKSEFYQSFLTWFDDFLKMVKENGCPLDFYTWHIYTPIIEEVVLSARYARAKLDEYGFFDTESHLNEWNYGVEGSALIERENTVGASFVAATLAVMQEERVDLAQYYDASRMSSYNGLLTYRTQEFTPVAHVFAAFNKLFKAENELKVEKDEREPYSIAASDGENILTLISNYGKEKSSLVVELPEKMRARLYKLTDSDAFVLEGEYVTPALTFACDKNATYFIEAERI